MAGGHPTLSAESLAAIRVVFFEECPEHLAELEQGLQALHDGADDWEIVNTIFRAVHSIKGGASIFELDELVQFAHCLESALAEVRSRAVSLDKGRIRALLKAADVLADLVAAAQENRDLGLIHTVTIEEHLARLFMSPHVGNAAAGAAQTAGAIEASDDPDAFAALGVVAKPIDFDSFKLGGQTDFSIEFRPYAALYAKANEPLHLLRELQRLGDVEVTLDDSAVPPLDQLTPDDAYLSWTVRLRTEQELAEVQDVFEFVEDDCELEISALAVEVATAGEDAPDRAEGLDRPETPTPPLGGQTVAPIAPPAQTIRVDLERVDRMIDLVSELVINQAMLAQRLGDHHLSRHSDVKIALEDLDQLTRHIQDSVMAIRAQPVRAVFQRMSRLVREVEVATGKCVRLVTEGESTEVDRTVIERLSDPLTHMIRNAIDHGIEAPEARLAAGKPAEGVLCISAAHRAGRIVIEVSDDGDGIDHQRVRGIAIQRGLIAPDAVLSDEELADLIFAPGFSTAKVVSDLSGRGVGLDVVRSSVQALGGRISVSSTRGVGSTFTLSLPLTLAVLDGMLVSVRGQTLIAPLTTLIESFQIRPGDVQKLGPKTAFLTVRSEHVPLIDLGEMLDYPPVPAPGGRTMAMMVEDDTGQRAALLVDEIQGQKQVVIKSLETNYRQVHGVAAATILGDGRVALILDINSILSTQPRLPGAGRQVEAA